MAKRTLASPIAECVQRASDIVSTLEGIEDVVFEHVQFELGDYEVTCHTNDNTLDGLTPDLEIVRIESINYKRTGRVLRNT